MGSCKRLPKYIGSFRVLHRKDNAYTIELPHRMRTHPTLYVRRLRPYYQHASFFEDEGSHHPQEFQADSCGHGPESQVESEVKLSRDKLTTARYKVLHARTFSPTGRTRTPVCRPTDQQEDATHSLHTREVHHARD